MNKTMKKGLAVFASVLLALGIILSMVFGSKAPETVLADGTPAWSPFNYVLMNEGQLANARTKVTYNGGKLTAEGGDVDGMGVIYHPEVNLDGFEINVSLNAWNNDSSDRWFGLSFTDVASITDNYNADPVYAKHSESFSAETGAGVLMELIPAYDGEEANGYLTVKFVNIATVRSVDHVTGNKNANAGAYLGTAGFDFTRSYFGETEQIVLCNTDGTVKTDYSNIKITAKRLDTGYAFEINDGYWKRKTNAPVETAVNSLSDDVLELLEIDRTSRAGTSLTEQEKEKIMKGSAFGGVIPYINWGDDLTSLANFENIVEDANGRLYTRFFYKDKFDRLEGNNSFTINSIGGESIEAEADLYGSKEVTGKLSATLKYTDLPAGVYPSSAKELVVVEAAESAYNRAKDNVEAVAAGKSYKVVNFKAKLNNDRVVDLTERVDITFDMSDYTNAKLYQISGKNVNEVNGTGTVEVKTNSTACFVIVYEGGDGAGSGSGSGGCGGAISSLGIAVPVVLVLAGFVVAKKRLLNK